MNLPLFIARRYFFSRKIANVIHAISFISLIGVMVGSFALIVVLSVFNGFEELVLKLYNSFDPDIKVSPVKGKYFNPTFKDSASTISFGEASEMLSRVQDWSETNKASYTIEENALVKYKDRQTIAKIKGITPEYLPSMGVDSMIYVGNGVITQDQVPQAIVGAGVASKLDLNIYSESSSLQLYVPTGKTSNFSFDPTDAFKRKNIQTSGIFSIQQKFDEKYILVPMDFIRELVDEEMKITGLEVNVKDKADIPAVKQRLTSMTGKNFEVKDRFEQHAWLYKIMNAEKLAVYLILSFILVIAAFNLIGALLMLVIEKKKDMAVLKSMGANSNLIMKIFFLEGIMLSSIGALLGIALGTLVCWLQMKYELIKLNSGNTFVLNAYPVSFKLDDFILVFLTVVVLGLIASYYPARTAYKQLTVEDLK